MTESAVLLSPITPLRSATPPQTLSPAIHPIAEISLNRPSYRERRFSWAPDGTALIFLRAEDEGQASQSLWLAQEPSFIPTRLIKQPGGRASWSPTGEFVAFVARRQLADYPETVWLMDADGTNPRDLLPGERAIRSVSSLKFLGPWLDNHTLVLMDACGTGCRTLVPLDVVTGEIQELCGQSEEDPLFLGMDYHWSPSLDRFVVTEGGGIPRIRLIQLNGYHDCREQNLPTPGEFHAWLPDGKAFLFNHWQWKPGQGDPSPVIAQVPRLYIWDVLQGKVTWTGPAGGYAGVWSPDGKHLAFFLLGNPRYEGQRLIGSDFVPGAPFPLFLVILDVQTEETLVFVPVEENISSEISYWFDQRKPVWSPDGEQLVYWAEGDDLWIMRWDGANQQRLTEGLAIVEVLWSSEGSKLAIATQSQLWIIERPAR
ncbi:MAG: hypothetical protein K8R89_07860 [Anaerolineae bacterium]|nr:hypothetical protein [Anaerolineae bacterium]